MTALGFFKIMFGDSITQHMYLPLLVARRVNHLTNKETQIEDASGQRWPVTLSHVKSSLAFQKGWPKFFHDHGLKVGELLVFVFHGSHFTVQIYTKSALEKTNFSNEMPQPTKKRMRLRRREDESFQTADVNSGDKTISAPLIPLGNEFQRHKTINAMANADFEISQPLPKAVNIEDPLCVFSRDDGFHEEHRNLLLDLSCFEVENRTSDANKRSLSCIGILEPIKSTGDDAMEGAAVIETDVIISDSVDTSIEPIKSAEDDAMEGTAVIETDVIISDSVDTSIDKFVADTQMAPHADVIMGDSGDISIDKFLADTQMAPHADLIMVDSGDIPIDKFLADTQMAPHAGSCKIAEREHAAKNKFDNSVISSAVVYHPLGQHTIKKECVMRENPEIAHQITKKVGDAQMAPHSGQAGGHSRDAFVNKSYEKPSDNSNIKKGMLDDFFNFQEAFLSIGSGKIAERELAVQSKFGKSIASSVAVKHPSGGHHVTVKQERVENVYNQVSSGGKGQPVVGKHAPMISAQVKVEPGTIPSDTISSFSNRPFSAEVNSTLFLEVPIRIIGSGRGISLSHEWRMTVFLRGPSGRIWPIIYQECTGGRGFSNNWTKFCKENNINQGDKCKFTVKDEAEVCIYHVDVTRVRGGTAEMLDDVLQISRFYS